MACDLRSWKLWMIAAAGFTTLAAIPAVAQHAADGSTREFAVVSIHKSHAQIPFPTAELKPGEFVLHNGTAAFLIQIAYGLPTAPDGGPAWTRSERFNLDAQVGEVTMQSWKGLSVEEQKARTLAMLRILLADRFHLQTKLKTRKMPVYELVVAQGGPKLTPAGAPHPRLDPKPGWSRFSTENASVAQFAQALRAEPELQGREIVDKTGLSGLWDFDLQWLPRIIFEKDSFSANLAQGERVTSQFQPLGPSYPQQPTLFDALKQQLGLKLVPERAPIQVLGIEHIEKP